MRTSHILAIAAIACLFTTVQSVITAGACVGTGFDNCATCSYDYTAADNITAYNCYSAKVGYYMTYNADTGAGAAVVCPAGYASCSANGNQLSGSSPAPTYGYWVTPAKCGENTLATANVFGVCTNQPGALTCSSTGEILTCDSANGYYLFAAMTDLWPAQRTVCIKPTPTTTTITVSNLGALTVAEGSYCSRNARTQTFSCVACSAGSYCSGGSWAISDTVVVQYSPMACFTNTYLTQDLAAGTQSCTKCIANAGCPNGQVICDAGYYMNPTAAACTKCPTLGTAYNTCDRKAGVTCCKGYYKSYDKVTCNACPTLSTIGVFSQEGVIGCNPSAIVCDTAK